MRCFFLQAEGGIRDLVRSRGLGDVYKRQDPKIGETVYDPAAGTAGFLVAAYNHIRLANSSPGGTQSVELDGKTLALSLIHI